MIGFSGTPYLEKAEKFTVTDKLMVGISEITNTVHYYPLVDGVGNFLKCPTVKIADIANSSRIIENGVREFPICAGCSSRRPSNMAGVQLARNPQR